MEGIVEFLEACIAEDVDKAEYGDAHLAGCDRFTLYAEGGLPCTCGLADRLLAECALKTALVKNYVAPGESPHPGLPCIDPLGLTKEESRYWEGPCTRHMESWDNQHHSEFVIRTLAALYSERPGYRQEWAA